MCPIQRPTGSENQINEQFFFKSIKFFKINEIHFDNSAKMANHVPLSTVCCFCHLNIVMTGTRYDIFKQICNILSMGKGSKYGI